MQVGLEQPPIPAVPGKVDAVAVAVLDLLDVAHLALAEDLGAPVPGVGDVGDERGVLGAVVEARRVLARQRRRRHLDAAAVGPVGEARRLAHAAELVALADQLGLLLEQLELGQLRPLGGVLFGLEDVGDLFVVCAVLVSLLTFTETQD